MADDRLRLLRIRVVVTRREGEPIEVRLVDEDGTVLACNDAARVADLVGGIDDNETE